MNITYDEAVVNMTTYAKSKALEKDINIELTKELKIPPALESVQMLDDIKNIYKKTLFVRDMLEGNGVEIKLKDKTLCSFQINEGMEFEDIELFKTHPAIYRFFIESVFSVFLKNSYPLLSEFQEAE